MDETPQTAEPSPPESQGTDSKLAESKRARRASRSLTTAMWILLLGSVGLFSWALSTRGGKPAVPEGLTIPPQGTLAHLEWRIQRDADAYDRVHLLRDREDRNAYLLSVEVALAQLGETLDLADTLRFDAEGNPTALEPSVTQLTAPLRVWLNDLSRQTTFGSLTEEEGSTLRIPALEGKSSGSSGEVHREEQDR